MMGACFLSGEIQHSHSTFAGVRLVSTSRRLGMLQ